MLRTPEQISRELEEIGEDRVRLDLSRGIYSGTRFAVAQEWVRNKDYETTRAKDRRMDELSIEQIRLSRSATKAAWVASVVAIASVVVSIFALWISWSAS